MNYQLSLSMKRFFSLSLILLVMGCLSAQPVRVMSSDNSHISISFSEERMNLSSMSVDGSDYTVVTMPECQFSQVVGAPMLPEYTRVVEVPLCADVRVSVVTAQKVVRHLSCPVAPLQPAYPKSDTSSHPFMRLQYLYEADTLWGNPLVRVEKMGVARDRNLVRIVISPMRCNPVTGELVQVVDADFEVTFVDADLSGTRQMKRRYASPFFKAAPDLLNPIDAPKDAHTILPLRYLIVCHSDFRGALDDFMSWKRRQGFITDIVYTDELSGNDANTIADYLRGQYTEATDEMPAPSFLLIVGDVDRIPAFNSRVSSFMLDDSHVTDLYYATWTPNDHIPDCYYGRITATSTEMLASEMAKIMMYEQCSFPDPSYLDNAVLIAGKDSGRTGDNAYSYADPAMDYIAYNYVNVANGYTSVHYYKNLTTSAPDGVTVSGSSSNSATAVTLRSLYNEGVGWVNYSAHGMESSWTTPSFTTSHVSNMTNYDKPSIMIGNCCLSGSFNYRQPCLGEALLQKDGNAGAAAYIGATNYTYWTEDYYWAIGSGKSRSSCEYSSSSLGVYDRLFHSHGETFDDWKTTMGSINYAGNMNVSSTYELYYWEVYHLFGDPSMIPWLRQPQEALLQCDDVVVLGSSSLNVQTEPYAYVALVTSDAGPVAATIADATGSATLTLPADILLGTYEVSVTAQGFKPAFQTVNLVVPGAYNVFVSNFSAQNAVAGDTVRFNFQVRNADDMDFDQVALLFSAAPEQMTFLSQQPLVLTNLRAGDTVVLTQVVPAILSPALRNKERVLINVTTVIDTMTTVFPMGFKVSAPALAASVASSRGYVRPDSTLTVQLNLSNKGAVSAGNLHFSVVNHFDMFSSATLSMESIAELPVDSTQSLILTIALSPNLPTPLATIPFDLVVQTNETTCVFPLTLSGKDYDDFETGDFSRLAWQNDTEYPWTIDAGEAYRGIHSARSFDFNGQGNRASVLTISQTVITPDTISYMRKVSSEANYDKFYFLLDGQELDCASGTDEGWQSKSFLVPAGTHSYTFKYEKDGSIDRGSDCVWIDDVELPSEALPAIYQFDTMCVSDVPQPVPDSSFFTVDTIGSEVVYAFHRLLSPQVSIRVSDTAFYPGQPVVLQAQGAQYYHWSTGDTTATITIVPQSVDDLTVTVEGILGGCTDTATVTIKGRTLAIHPIQDESQMTVVIYPNPAEDDITVHAAGLRGFVLHDCCGREVLRGDASSDVRHITLKGLPKGVYILRLNTATTSAVRKIVKK